jgi:hypothetical protein
MQMLKEEFWLTSASARTQRDVGRSCDVVHSRLKAGALPLHTLANGPRSYYVPRTGVRERKAGLLALADVTALASPI